MASSSTGTVNISLSSRAQFIFLAVAAVASVGLTYGAKLFPTIFGATGLSAVIALAYSFALHLYEDNHKPGGLGYEAAFLINAAGVGLIGAATYFLVPGMGLEEWLLWVIVVVSALAHTISEDAGASLPQSWELWITAGLGFFLSLATFAYQNPTAGWATLITTALATVTQWFHITEVAGQVQVTPTPQTIPPPPATPAGPT